MSLIRTFALVLVAAVIAPPAAFAKAEDDEEEEEASDEEEEGGDEAASEDEPAEEEAAPKKKSKKAEPFVKQNLSGHDMGTSKKENLFEKDRFFVDKVDTAKGAKSTLIQGSLQSSSLLFTERGGSYGVAGPMNTPLGDNSAKFSRVFTELRLQTDFRHIKGSRWEARVDARARVVNTPEDAPRESMDPNRIQSGFNGTNEYDVRELWLFRSGKRSDIFFGRQFVADLGGVKFDGLRVDYASSRTLTLIGFGGLYPLRGSRSLTTDYQPLKADDGSPAGRLVGAGGFGGAYRTTNAYGAVGGVVLYPFSSEQARVFVTSTGYLRSGATLDVYHFALVDLYGSQGAGITNLSLGANYKPNPRLRLIANINRVDVDTLAVQANAFLADPENQPTLTQNETYFRRLATNVGRVGVSAGLGQFSRFELSFQASYRYRPGVAIPQGNGTTQPATINLQGNKGVELYGSFVDRRSIKDLRLGVDATRSFGIGEVAFNRSEILSLRAFAGRELKNGHGEWEGEVQYTTTKDSASGIDCINVYTCYGSSTGAIAQVGGNLYYRVNRDWFVLGQLGLTRQSLSYNRVMMPPADDPAVYGVTAFFRAAYRF